MEVFDLCPFHNDGEVWQRRNSVNSMVLEALCQQSCLLCSLGRSTQLCVPQEDDLQESHKHLITEVIFPLCFINEKWFSWQREWG